MTLTKAATEGDAFETQNIPHGRLTNREQPRFMHDIVDPVHCSETSPRKKNDQTLLLLTHLLSQNPYVGMAGGTVVVLELVVVPELPLAVMIMYV